MKNPKPLIKITPEQRERKRIANILHDDLQQILVATTFQLDEASKNLKKQEFGKTQDALNRGIASLHEAIRSTRLITKELLDNNLA